MGLRPPGKTRADPILEAPDLARELGVQPGELREIATQSRVPFNVSTLTGFWIQRRDLPPQCGPTLALPMTEWRKL
jgi:hypothetical protein